MIRYAAILGTCVAAMTLSGSLEANDAKPEMIWFFRIVWESGHRYESSDLSAHGPVMMYGGSAWKCEKNAGELLKSGEVMAGFMCRSGDRWLHVSASCSPTTEDVDKGRVTLGDASGYMLISVSCLTKPAANAKVKSLGTNL